ncbi:MAG: ATP-dependent sacrificial sulfur transferase LarE [Synergistaceae bacterium]|nr:ATP-dependent sacrificial sulfur transferase LarE [Synergistaceae bacterium]
MTLEEFFAGHPSGALAFSGGTDSSLLLWAAKEYGANYTAYYLKTAFQPKFEEADARRTADELFAKLVVVGADIIRHIEISSNPEDRCYHCKLFIFSKILERAAADGHTLIIDGTNASDDELERPGMRALREIGVLSPLRKCGITKAEVRKLSKDAGLSTWNKPAYSCLATRIPAGTRIRAEDLRHVEDAENALFVMGFSDFRVRVRGTSALLQLAEEDMPRFYEMHGEVLDKLKQFFTDAEFDPKPRTTERR